VKRREVLLYIVLVLLASLGPGARAMAQQGDTGGLAESQFTVRVEDQEGAPTAGATLIVRDGVTYKVVANPKTNAEGIALLGLDSTRWYVVLVYYTDRGSRETWWYGYILAEDWNPTPLKVMRRTDPWIGTVTLAGEPWPGGQALPVGQEQSVEVTIDHGLATTHYDLKIRVGMWVDDDGELPYLYETMSDVQSFHDGITPFHVSYMPDTSGHYMVRFRVDRQFENNDWEISDEGGWEWSVDVTEPTSMYTATPTATLTPSATPTLATCIVEGVVFEDMAYNNVLDVGDRPLPGVEVLLTTLSGQRADNQISGVEGRYRFTISTPGDYRVQLGYVPVGYRHAGWVYTKSCEPGIVHENLDFPLWRWYCRLPVLVRP
jgi:hypothetical protein